MVLGGGTRGGDRRLGCFLGNGRMCGRAVPDLDNVAGVLELGRLGCVLVISVPTFRGTCGVQWRAKDRDTWRHQQDRAGCPAGSVAGCCCPVSDSLSV